MFIGEVRPLYNRWTWPLRVMQPGDYFIVDKLLRSPEEVRHLMSVRAAQLGIRLSVTKEPVDHPGFTKVEMVDMKREEERPDGLSVDFATASQRIATCYAYNLDRLPFGTVYTTGSVRVDAPQVSEMFAKRIIFDAYEQDFVVGIVFDKLGFTAYALPRGTTVESWKPPLTIEEIMGS